MYGSQVPSQAVRLAKCPSRDRTIQNRTVGISVPRSPTESSSRFYVETTHTIDSSGLVLVLDSAGYGRYVRSAIPIRFRSDPIRGHDRRAASMRSRRLPRAARRPFTQGTTPDHHSADGGVSMMTYPIPARSCFACGDSTMVRRYQADVWNHAYPLCRACRYLAGDVKACQHCGQLVARYERCPFRSTH